MRRNANYYIRKAHRYLGVFLGIQFIFWTVGGLYFSWSDLDRIHGDHLLQESQGISIEDGLISPAIIMASLQSEYAKFSKMELVEVLGEPFYEFHLPNGEIRLYSAIKGNLRHQLTEREAISIAKAQISFDAKVQEAKLLSTVGDQHEYRQRHLPVWAITYAYEGNPVAYVDAVTGKFERIRHTRWRVFDWLWMMHTMDYETRDDFGNWLLKIFSIIGLITVLSGFLLFSVSYNKREFNFLNLKES
ncbi:MAG: hypothetical protein RID25_26300 [Cyclobacteriaceae bacterium]